MQPRALTSRGTHLLLRAATPTEIIPLRAAILRPGQPLSASHYPNDASPDTRHAAAFTPDGRCVAAGSIFREPWDDSSDAYRLRGMVVDPPWQNAGIGRALLSLLVAEAIAARVQLLWCNARLPAVGFYTRQGWTTTGTPFTLPDVPGGHHRMTLHLTPAKSPV